ncbi:MAG: helix-turn-helix domain-containing protein [Rhodospirillaceae bacterium]
MSATHLNQRELSRRWHLSPYTLERWRSLGEGPRFLKIGGKVLYRQEDIEAYEAEHLRQGTGVVTPPFLQPAC